MTANMGYVRYASDGSKKIRAWGDNDEIEHHVCWLLMLVD